MTDTSLGDAESHFTTEALGEPAGPGRYVTIYADAGHAWMTIDGRRFDTVALQETGTRWSSTMTGSASTSSIRPSIDASRIRLGGPAAMKADTRTFVSQSAR